MTLIKRNLIEIFKKLKLGFSVSKMSDKTAITDLKTPYIQ